MWAEIILDKTLIPNPILSYITKWIKTVCLILTREKVNDMIKYTVSAQTGRGDIKIWAGNLMKMSKS